jgi:flagellar hook-basal body complex protein FliE
MDIKTNSLYAQMQSMQLEATGNRFPVAGNEDIGKINPSSSNFGDLLKTAVNNVNDIQQEVGQKRKAFEMGDESVTLADVMIAGAKAGVAFDATVQVRNKFVEAYKEIMSMPV